jgi:signal transduction histidine kinase
MPEDLTDADDQDMRPLAGDADRITKIVKGLDELKKAQELGRALRKQPVELSQFLNTIVEKTRGPFDDKLVTFSLECERALILTADPDCLMRILANLLDNAAKAVKNDGTVTVSAAAKNDYIEFAIRDTGTGIRPKDLPHIFERFYRASGSGIGLGLTIVKELVDASGGSIEVRTSLGKGSVFTVRLPKS